MLCAAVCLMPLPDRTFQVVVVRLLYLHSAKQGSSTFMPRHYSGTYVGSAKPGGCTFSFLHLPSIPSSKSSTRPFHLPFLRLIRVRTATGSIGLSFSELFVSGIVSTKWMVPGQTCCDRWYLRQVRWRFFYGFAAHSICVASKAMPEGQPIDSDVSWTPSIALGRKSTMHN